MSTLLQKVLDFDNLSQAWEKVGENNGIPGVDHISTSVWARTWEERLIKLAESVRSNTYEPSLLKTIHIKKQNRREYRKLRIPVISDRILQRAVLQVLYPIYEPQFLNCSFGYRPGRGLDDAVESILVIRTNGNGHVLDADIDDFFNQIDQTLLLEFLEEDLSDHSLIQLIKRWLKMAQLSKEKEIGIAMGSPLSPLFANIFLHRLDKAVASMHFPMVRYADDFLVFSQSEEEIHMAYNLIEKKLEELKLQYKPIKTQITTFKEGFDFIGVHFKEDTYEYIWQNKRVEVSGNEIDALFGFYGPRY